MLTKDLVQATVRNGKLFPKFIKPEDGSVVAEAKTLCDLFADAKGRVVSELEEDIKGAASSPRSRGFAKILMDHCEIAEPSDEIMEMRWKTFAISERLRKNPDLSHQDFVDSIATEMNETVVSLKQNLFADLPSARIVEKFESVTTDELIDRYNLSHVTTFLCFADDVAVTIVNATIAQKRELMRRLKFHRLMSDVDVDHDAGSITLELSGPLRLFGKAQGYALRIANFFPFVASFPEWKLDAVVTWKTKKVAFSIDHKSGVKTKSSRSHGGYIPKEFEQVMTAINEAGEIKIMPGEDFIHLGKQSYCFPDFNIKSGRKSFGVELFHPWHKGQLKHRIEAAARSKAKNLLIGIERSLLKDAEIKKLCEVDPWFIQYGFEFSQFPTPNVIKRAVTRHD